MGDAVKQPSFYRFWLSFFQTAGIPPEFDAAYAKAFNDNRLRPDMMLELDKTMLGEMGVIAMGDKFAIIRHAIATHEDLRVSEIEGRPIDLKMLEDGSDDEEEQEREVLTELAVACPESPTDSEPECPPLPPPLSPTEIPLPPSSPPPLPPLPPEPDTPITPTVTFVNTFSESEVVFRNRNQYSYESLAHKSSSSHTQSTPRWNTKDLGHDVGHRHFINEYYRTHDKNYTSVAQDSPSDQSSTSDSEPQVGSIAESQSLLGTYYNPSLTYPPWLFTPSHTQVKSESLLEPFGTYYNPVIQYAASLLSLDIPPPEQHDQHSYSISSGRNSDKEGSPERVKRVFLFDPPPSPTKRPARVPTHANPEDKTDMSLYFPPMSDKDIQMEMELKSETPIDGENVGFKMLAKMGWNKGTSLGHRSGLKEPLKLEIRRGRMGLGAKSSIQDFRAKKYVKFVSPTKPNRLT